MSQAERKQQNPDRLASSNSEVDERFISLGFHEQACWEDLLDGLDTNAQELLTELFKRLDEKPGKVLILITTTSMSNKQLAVALDCSPKSIKRYRQAIRSKLEEIINERDD